MGSDAGGAKEEGLQNDWDQLRMLFLRLCASAEPFSITQRASLSQTGLGALWVARPGLLVRATLECGGFELRREAVGGIGGVGLFAKLDDESRLAALHIHYGAIEWSRMEACACEG